MLKSNSAIHLSVVILVCLFANSLIAQSTTATLSGTVTDEGDSVVPGAKVTVSNNGTGFTRRVVTNEKGEFSVPLLPPNSYLITIERQGFATVELSSITLNVGDRRSLQIKLKIGQVSETVEVTRDAPLIDNSSSVSTTIDQNLVENLPLNGRSIQTLITLSPGVVGIPSVPNAGGGSSQGQFSVNGQRGNSNYVTVDGVSGNFSAPPFSSSLAQNGSGSLPATNVSGGFSNLVSVDALQEFSIQTSTFAPEFGRSPGAQVSLVSRSGDNEFHGSVYNYLRNDVFDARDFFDIEKPPLRFNNFGGTFSGPVIAPGFGEGTPAFHKLKDSTFFFFSYEGQRFVLPQATATTVVPTLATRQNAITTEAQVILNAHPLPNGEELLGPMGQPTGGANFRATYSNPNSSDSLGIRLDHAIGEKATIWGRFNYAPSKSRARSLANLSFASETQQNTRTLTIGSTQIFSSNVVNEILFNYSQQESNSFSEFDSFGGAQAPPANFLAPPRGDRIDVSVFGVTNVFGGFSYGNTQENGTRQFQIVDNFSYRIGSHQLKFGGDYRLLLPSIRPSDFGAAYFLGSLENLNNGISQIGITTGGISPSTKFQTYSFYGQDTWQVNKRLTLTYGARWEINPAPTGRGDIVLPTFSTPPDLTQLDQSGLTLAPLGTPYYETEFTKFAPRFGASYLVRDKPGREIVVRGGIGIFYDLGQTGFGEASWPYTNFSFNFFTPVPIPDNLFDFGPPDFTPSPTNRASVTAAAQDYTLPITYQWNLTTEFSLGSNQTVTVGYVAAQGRKLITSNSLQFAEPGQVPDVFFSDNFIGANIIENRGESDFHSLQLQYVRRLTKGLQAIVNYTWSHSIDNASNDLSIAAPGLVFSQELFRGDSDFDVRNNFSTAISYNLPVPKFGGIGEAILKNWTFSTVFTARSGLPYTVFIQEISPFGNVQAVRRPDLTGQTLYIDDPGVPTGRRLNPAAFDFDVPGTMMGNLGRNSIRGPGLWQADIGLSRTFKFGDNVKLLLRGESFNIFNRASFLFPSIPTGVTGGLFGIQPDFGVITQSAARSFNSGGGGLNPLFQTGGPRSFQFAARISF